jgi:hypothetical protein
VCRTVQQRTHLGLSAVAPRGTRLDSWDALCWTWTLTETPMRRSLGRWSIFNVFRQGKSPTPKELDLNEVYVLWPVVYSARLTPSAQDLRPYFKYARVYEIAAPSLALAQGHEGRGQKSSRQVLAYRDVC